MSIGSDRNGRVADLADDWTALLPITRHEELIIQIHRDMEDALARNDVPAYEQHAKLLFATIVQP